MVDAAAFALLFLRTNAAADSGQGAGFLQRAGCFEHLALLNVLDCRGDVVIECAFRLFCGILVILCFQVRLQLGNLPLHFVDVHAVEFCERFLRGVELGFVIVAFGFRLIGFGLFRGDVLPVFRHDLVDSVLLKS